MSATRPLLLGASGDIGAGFRKVWGGTAIYAGRNAAGSDRRLDLAQPEDWPAEILEGVSHCLISAGYAKPDDCFKNQAATRAVNVTGTARLLDLCRARGVTPVFFSSEQVYGTQTGLAREDAPVVPATVYGQQKLEIEDKIRREFSKHLILRVSRVEYGFPAKSSLIADCAAKLLRGDRRFAGDQLINLLYIDDLVEIVRRLMAEGHTGTFNVGGQEYLSRSVLAALVRERLAAWNPTVAGGGPIELVSLASFPSLEPRSTALLMSCQKLTAALKDFTPRSVAAILDSYEFGALDGLVSVRS